MAPYSLRHARKQSSVLCAGWLWWLELGIYAGGGSEKGGDFLINELGSLMGPSKAHVIRGELLFLEALLSQHKNICAFQ